jgi:aspartate oxidase
MLQARQHGLPYGGNRLASTYPLEGLVFGASVADYIEARGNDDLKLRRVKGSAFLLNNLTVIPSHLSYSSH